MGGLSYLLWPLQICNSHRHFQGDLEMPKPHSATSAFQRPRSLTMKHKTSSGAHKINNMGPGLPGVCELKLSNAIAREEQTETGTDTARN